MFKTLRHTLGIRSEQAKALSKVEKEREKIRQELHELMEKEKGHNKINRTTQDVKDKAREIRKKNRKIPYKQRLKIPYKQRLENAKDMIGKDIKTSIENKQKELEKNALKVKDARKNKGISKGYTAMTREQEKKRTGKAQKKMQDIIQERAKYPLLNNSLLDNNAKNAEADIDKHIGMLQENANNLQEKQDDKIAIVRDAIKYNNNNSNNNSSSNNSSIEATKLAEHFLEKYEKKQKLGGKKTRKTRKTKK